MFEFSMQKEPLLLSLLTVSGAVDKKQAMPILSNVLLRIVDNQLVLTATDLEIEITARVPCISLDPNGSMTVPAKKMVDIVRSLNDQSHLSIALKDSTLIIKEGRSQFKLATLPADHYPCTLMEAHVFECSIPRASLIYLLQTTHFAMSQQDVRIFLNGVLLEINLQSITAVATDGHRMAVCCLPHSDLSDHQRFLVPRKGVVEMLRLLNNIPDEHVQLAVGKNHIKLVTSQYTFSSKLIEARFPPYLGAIPKGQDKQVIIDRDVLKRALSRIVILAHEKSRAVLLHIQPEQLTLISHNQEQEEAVESVAAEISGEELKIAINATYLMDVLNHLPEGQVRLSFTNTDSSMLVEAVNDKYYQYVIMPMKL